MCENEQFKSVALVHRTRLGEIVRLSSSGATIYLNSSMTAVPNNRSLRKEESCKHLLASNSVPLNPVTVLTQRDTSDVSNVRIAVKSFTIGGGGTRWPTLRDILIPRDVR